MRVLAALLALAATAFLTAGVLGAGLRVAQRTAPPRPTQAPARGDALEQSVYVWQRSWTPAVSQAVATAPEEVRQLRVLMAEVPASSVWVGATRETVWPAVDLGALARSARPVIAVLRIDGRRLPQAMDIDAVVERVKQWRAARVDVRGIEIDHDCATAALDDYAAWLEQQRPRHLIWSITALPTWASSPALPRVAAAVHHVVVQVHAVRPDKIFDPEAAMADLRAFAAAVPEANLRVALPTYRVRVHGQLVSASFDELSGFLRALDRDPIPNLHGVAWFRMPVDGDGAALPIPMLVALMRGEAPPSRATVVLVARGPGRYDVVLENRGGAAAPWPTVMLDGDIAAADLVHGYRPEPDHHSWHAPLRMLAPGRHVVIGWVAGKDVLAAER